MRDSFYQQLTRAHSDTNVGAYLSENEFLDLSTYFEMVTAPQGEVIYREGDHGSYLALVMSGKVKLAKTLDEGGYSIVIGLIGPGAIVGEMSLVADAHRAVTAIAMSDLQLLTLSRRRYQDLLLQRPDLALKLLQLTVTSVGHRLRTAYQRIAHLLA